MKILKYISFLFFVAFAIPAFAQEQPITKVEKKMIRLIASLREVRSANKMMLKYNGQPLVIEIDGEPAKGRRFYTVAVYEDMKETEHLAILYRFDVHPKTYAIYFWDLVDDKQVPLKVWRVHGSKW